MTNTVVANDSASISTTAARLAMAAIIAYQVLLVVLIFLRPDLDPSWHTLSEWAIGPHGWMMSVAFLLSAFSYAALFVMLRSQLHGIMGRVGQGILLISVIGAAGVGFCTTDPMPIRPPLSPIGTVHVIFGTAQLALFPFAALLISLSLVRKNRVWARARRVLLWIAGLPLFGFLAFALHSSIFVFPLGPGAYGPGVNIGWPPRFAFLTYALWIVTVAWQAIKCGVASTTKSDRCSKKMASPIPAQPRLHLDVLSANPNLGHWRGDPTVRRRQVNKSLWFGR